MSKDKFTFDDIDDILAEFYKSYNEAEKSVADIKAASAVNKERPAPVEQISPETVAARVTVEKKAPAKPAEESYDFSGVAEKLYSRAKSKEEKLDFSSASENLRAQAKVEAENKPAAKDPQPEEPVDSSAEAPAEPAAKPEAEAKLHKQKIHSAVSESAAAKSRNAGSSFEEFEALFSSKAIKEEAEARSHGAAPKASRPAASKESSAQTRLNLDAETSSARREPPVRDTVKAEAKSEKPQKLKSEKPAKPRAEKKEKPVQPEFSQPQVIQPKKKFSPLHALLSLVFACVCVISLAWVLLNVHPASGNLSSAEGDTVLKLADKLDVYMNNVASDALGELSYIKKIYTLQESDTVAPVPNPDGFGTTRDVAVIQDVIKRAAPLLEGQTVVFDPNADFVPDTDFMYYLDDTIMVIAWKEYINERCCTMAEVKIAHGSQLRRKLAEDSYSSSVQYYASDMANASNAVIAINGDFYAFRDLGITVYQRKLYRNNPATVDSCFFTASGDMLFSRAGELMGEGEAQRFIEENDVVFAVAFGPILVDNGELQYCESYPIGEINMEYSRSCIGMTDDLHYLLMTINHTPDARPRATINELGRYIYSKGVEKAYTLDGGQTAEIVMMGGPINHVDFGYERVVSDIIYFATAIPNEEVSR